MMKMPLWLTFCQGYNASKIALPSSRFNLCNILHSASAKEGAKVFPYLLPSVGPRADPGVQAVSPQDRESSPATARDRRSTAEPRSQPGRWCYKVDIIQLITIIWFLVYRNVSFLRCCHWLYLSDFFNVGKYVWCQKTSVMGLMKSEKVEW